MSGAGYAHLLRKMNLAAEEADLSTVRKQFEVAMKARKGEKRKMAYKLFLKACANAGELHLAEQYFEAMLAESIQPNAKTLGKLIEAASKVGRQDRALHWFQFLQKKFKPELNHYNMMAQACFVSGDLSSGEHWLFTEAPKKGFCPDIVGYNQYLDALSSKGLVKEAQELMSKAMKDQVTPNLRSYNSLINVCAKASEPARACEAFNALKEAKLQPDSISFNSVLDAFARAGTVEAMEAADAWLEEMVQAAMQPDVVSCSSLIRSTSPETRGECLHRMHQRRAALDIWAYASVVDACAKLGDSKGAAQWLRKAHEENLQPNVVTYNSVINAYAREGRSDLAESCFLEMMHSRIEPNLISFNSVLKACRDGRRVSSSVLTRMFQGMAPWSIKPDLISYNSAIAASVSSEAEILAEWIGRMQQENLTPDGVTFTTLMQATQGNLEQAEAWFDWLQQAGGHPNGHAYASIIAMCRDEVEKAEKWMKRCLEDPSVSHDDVRLAFLQMLRGVDAGKWLTEMKDRSFNPGIEGYTSVISWCSRRGDAQKAKKYFAGRHQELWCLDFRAVLGW